jgi:hypothetical protein
MKKFKKLIPALAALLVSATVMSTATFAWFSMNKEVDAASMEITATSENPYLVINEESNEINTSFGTSADAMATYGKTGTGANLKLVTPLNVASNVAYYADATAKTAGESQEAAGETNTNKTTPSKFTTDANVLWGTTTSSDPALVEAANVTTLVASADLVNYVLKNELYFKVLPGNVNGTNLTCTGVTFSDGTNSIAASGRVLLVSETGAYQLFKLVDGAVTTYETGSDAALLATVTQTPQKVTAFFYFDGTDASAYTNNATDLTAVTAQFSFAID